MTLSYFESRDKIDDGYALPIWPEFQALFNRLNVTIPKIPKRWIFDAGIRGIELNINLDTTTLTLIKYNQEPEVFEADVTGFEVYRWPEYIALCEKLGVNRDCYEVKCHMRVIEGEMPLITQTYAMTQPKVCKPINVA